MTRPVKRLYDLEIDEISLVDRPANQHGLVAIAKRAGGSGMALVDADGYVVDEDDIEIGESVFDSETGEQFVMASAEEAEALGYTDEPDYDYDYEDEDQLVGVGKAASDWVAAGRTAGRTAGRKFNGAGDALAAGRTAATTFSRKRGVKTGGAALAGAGVGYEARKSLGSAVLEDLSKALDNDDRDEVISKLANIVSDAQADANAAWQVAKSLQQERELDDYSQLASEYDIPVDPREFGGILMRVSKALPPGDLDVLDRVLTASGYGFAELGYTGAGQSDVMSQVMAMANEAVGKSDGMTPEMLAVSIFEANPAAYDEYEAESR